MCCQLRLFILLVTFCIGASFSYAQPFNKMYSIACHNCYEPTRAPSIEDVLQYTTNLELDIWDTRKWFGIGGWKAMDRDWYVRHEGSETANINCCGGSLKDCLNRINKWSAQHEAHPVITVFIDKKENWSDADETRNPVDLDALILSIFPKEKIFTPATMMDKGASVRQAAANAHWPLPDSLKGRIIFVITDATLLTQKNRVLDQYLSARDTSAICFVAPEITQEAHIKNPPGIAANNIRQVIFYNMHYNQYRLGPLINEAGFLSRVFYAPETGEVLSSLFASLINYVAMYNYKLKVN